MSHYSVTVVLPSVPKDHADLSEMLGTILAPFDENTQVDPYKTHVTKPHPEWQQARANTTEVVRLRDETGLTHGEAFRKVWGDTPSKTVSDMLLDWPRGLAYDEAGIDPHDDVAIAAFYNDRYDDDDEKYEVDEQGLYSWSTYNPKSKWDWYELGGRWAGHFQLVDNPEGYWVRGSNGLMGSNTSESGVDCCRRGDVDVERMLANDQRRYGEYYDELKSGKAFGFDKEHENLTREEYITKRIMDSPPWQTWAILAEGVWKEPGEMGWFGLDNSTDNSKDSYREWFAKFWEMMPPTTYLAVVDCHI